MQENHGLTKNKIILIMTEIKKKKSLSLKGHKTSGPKQSKQVGTSKNVTIQVKRKKILSQNNQKAIPVINDPNIEINNESSKKQNDKAQTAKKTIKESPSASIDASKQKKKVKFDKDSKVEDFDNKELHLKEPKAKKQHNKAVKKEEVDLSSQHQFEKPTEPIKKEIDIPESITVSDLALKMSIKSSELIKVMMNMGVMATLNQSLDQDTAILLVEEMGHNAVGVDKQVEEMALQADTPEQKNLEPRAPIVTIMGHVDHGKTSILDFIRETKVAAGESGGITQRVGAYQVLHNDNKITFLDTPGHEAFTAMRARGAQSTDIVILVVAADDSVMPQTIEAINHAKAAEVPIVVAINKIDKQGANPDIVKRELSEKNVLVEEWGGKIQSVNTSAITGVGIDELMEAILLEAEVLDLKANQDIDCKGIVIDSKLDKGLGPVATVLIQKGTLKVGTPFICNNHPGKVRAIMNERNERISEAKPSDPVQILGFDQVPQAGDIFAEVENESDLKKIANERQRIKREIDLQMVQKTSLDSISAQIKEGDINNLNIIIKADSDGSIEALIQSIEKINNDEVGVDIVHKGVGNVTESDVLLAQASQAIVIGFGVQIPSNTKLLASQNNVEIRAYSIIYQIVEDVKMAVEGLLKPDMVEEVIGVAVVKESFKIPKIGFIAGSQVESGKITRDCFVRLIREEEELVSKGSITSLKRFKDDVASVDSGMECGISVEGVKKYFEGDRIVAYKINEIKRTLADS